MSRSYAAGAPAPLFLALILLIAPFNGCDQRPSTSQASSFLVISGDTQSWITPCGCTSNQSGGLMRRATFLKQLSSRGQVIYADAGGAVAGNSEYQRLKLEAILRGEMTMGVAAHNIGATEASMGPGFLRELGKRLNAPLISANVFDDTGAPIAPAAKIVNVGKSRVALVGLLGQAYATSGIRIDDPAAAFRRAIADLKGQYDTLIVLAYMNEEELEKLAAAAPEADAVVGGPTGQAIAPRRIGPTVLAAATNKGKFVIQLNLPGEPHEGILDGSIVELNGSYADDPQQQANLKSYLGELDVKDFRADQTSLVPAMPSGAPESYRIAGSTSCASCHKSSDKSWRDSHHSKALETIRAKNFDVDPTCQQCHTTGYGLPSGFVSRNASAATLGGVGCENCHGPSAAHVSDPKIKTPFGAADQCVRCHDHENSPKFDYKAYWPRIKHASDGKEPR